MENDLSFSHNKKLFFPYSADFVVQKHEQFIYFLWSSKIPSPLPAHIRWLFNYKNSSFLWFDKQSTFICQPKIPIPNYSTKQKNVGHFPPTPSTIGLDLQILHHIFIRIPSFHLHFLFFIFFFFLLRRIHQSFPHSNPFFDDAFVPFVPCLRLVQHFVLQFCRIQFKYIYFNHFWSVNLHWSRRTHRIGQFNGPNWEWGWRVNSIFDNKYSPNKEWNNIGQFNGQFLLFNWFIGHHPLFTPSTPLFNFGCGRRCPCCQFPHCLIC